MPIKSYLAHPHDGMYSELLSELSKLKGIDIIQSKNKDIAIIISDTDNDLEDNNIQIKINSIKSLKILSLVSGFKTN